MTKSPLANRVSTSTSALFPPGTNLLSGGIESVLVQWRYKQESQRDFLPRLGAAITHVAVSPDGSLFCTSHSDNSKDAGAFMSLLAARLGRFQMDFEQLEIVGGGFA